MVAGPAAMAPATHVGPISLAYSLTVPLRTAVTSAGFPLLIASDVRPPGEKPAVRPGPAPLHHDRRRLLEAGRDHPEESLATDFPGKEGHAAHLVTSEEVL